MPPIPDLLRSAASLAQMGQLSMAADTCREILKKQPRNPQALRLLGMIALHKGDLATAITSLTTASLALPRDTDLHTNLGVALLHARKFPESEAASRKAAQLDPRNIEALHNAALAQREQNRLGDTIASLEAAVAIDPARPDIQIALGDNLRDAGRVAEAIPHYRAALAHESHAPAASAAELRLAVASNYIETDPLAARTLHEAVGTRLTAQAAAQGVRPRSSFTNTRDEHRRLRVGFVSGDFRAHVCSVFFEPLLRHRDKERFHFTLYSTSPIEDHVTARFRTLSDNFRAMHNRADLGATIATDAIDILIDTTGHYDFSRLDVFARRAAPVQLTWLGYPNTTGLSEIDARIVDAITDPPGSDSSCTERLARLDPPFLCYQPRETVIGDAIPDTPPVSPSPVASGSFRGLTYGIFTNLSKITDPMIALWSTILQRAPGSRVILKSRWLNDDAVWNHLHARFTTSGAPPDAVQRRPYLYHFGDHAKDYADIDLALDTHPYAGTTTTCDSAYMGVPMLTLTGNTHASRVTASLNTALGLTDWIARSPDDYIAKAVAAAHDPSPLIALRPTLRDRLLASPLCNAPNFARRFESLLRNEWQRWLRD